MFSLGLQLQNAMKSYVSVCVCVCATTKEKTHQESQFNHHDVCGVTQFFCQLTKQSRSQM